MKVITVLIFAIIFLSFDIQEDEFFSYETTTCNFIYTVDEKYGLRLKGENRFIITIQLSDSRYPQAISNSISGKFLKNADTIMFKADYASETYLLKNTQLFYYLHRKDSLIALNNPFILPKFFVKQK